MQGSTRPAAPAVGMPRRRAWMAGLGASVLFAPGPWAWLWAQGAGGNPQLLKLPKIALVIGNSAYAQAPLRNPANDAKGMAEALNALGYEVTVRLDANRAAMQAAVDSYVRQLAERKCVGLFFFAGHGVQINWRNYLLPADARVASNDDIEKQGIDVNAMTGALGKTGNALNLIILDACRDAPFGEANRQKGLSQMDAPRSTLLAYATAPGNVASDGEGANGLYTEHLLREIKVPDAKVEDVFKRVRLGVRRKSNGAQIPWESTSLEDDYYFRPPASLSPPGDAERARRFAEELKLWERIEKDEKPEPLEEYLRLYPSGNFSELAQFRLDRILSSQGERRIEIVTAKANPYATVTARADTAYRVGDSYSYRVSDLESGRPKPGQSRQVIAIDEREVRFNDGHVTDLLGNQTRRSDGRQLYGAQWLPAEYAIGKHWVTRFDGKAPNGQDVYSEFSARIVALEKITVAAGTFDCYRLEYRGVTRPFLPPSWNVQIATTNWRAPGACRAPVLIETRRIAYGMGGQAVLENDRYELEAFRQG